MAARAYLIHNEVPAKSYMHKYLAGVTVRAAKAYRESILQRWAEDLAQHSAISFQPGMDDLQDFEACLACLFGIGGVMWAPGPRATEPLASAATAFAKAQQQSPQ